MNVSLSKDYITILGAFIGLSEGEKDPRQLVVGYVARGKKFVGGDHIINRVLWDKQHDQKEFTVGYEDRFLGLLEMPFDEFIESEVPRHRLKYFKKSGHLMWDRSKRINRF